MDCKCWVSGDKVASGVEYMLALVEAQVSDRLASSVVEKEEEEEAGASCISA